MTTERDLLIQARIALGGFPDNRCAAEAFKKISAYLDSTPAVPPASVATVQELSAELCRRIAQGKPLGDYHEQTDPDKQGIPGELDTISEAKDICRDILHAAKANGLGGCILCKS